MRFGPDFKEFMSDIKQHYLLNAKYMAGLLEVYSLLEELRKKKSVIYRV